MLKFWKNLITYINYYTQIKQINIKSYGKLKLFLINGRTIYNGYGELNIGIDIYEKKLQGVKIMLANKL